MSIVYILTNEAMPGYIKIGRTETSVEQRMRELDKTPVPLPFQCSYSAKVPDYVTIEKALHTAFGDHRVRSNREFFKLDPYRAKAIVELLAIAEVTPGGDVFEDEESAKAVEKASRASGRFNFPENGSAVGSTLQYASDSSITCQVQDEQNVIFDGQVVSPSRAALLANASRGGKATAMQGPIWWLYQGDTLASIRDQKAESENQ